MVRRATQPDPAEGRQYDSHRRRTAERQRDISTSGREIGPLPKVANRRRRKKCERSLRAYCETYRRETFNLKWSPDHLRVIKKLEAAILGGGLVAIAMPRGTGKTSLCEAAAEWAILYGHRRFLVIIGATEEAAAESLDSIKMEIEENELLLADFPETCYPVVRLEGINNRANGQTLAGERTRISWTAKEVVFPTVPGAKSSGARIRVAGITGRIRGMKAKDASGQTIRPDFVLPDDPQTDESARMLGQNVERVRLLAGAVLGLAGPGVKISGVMPCTVIHPEDMADQMLDRQKHPEWNGERTKMVYRWPTDAALWDQYAKLRADGMRAGDEGAAATAFYRENRTAMDAGAEVAWPERFLSDELSSIQHAFNLRQRDERAFMAECQNDPLPAAGVIATGLTAEQVAAKVSTLPRRTAPRATSRVTAFVDVGAHLLWYMVVAWDERFGGTVIDYGAYPEQGRDYFAKADARPGLQDLPAVRGQAADAAIYAALTATVGAVCGGRYRQEETGAEMAVERCLVDANWGPATDLVYDFCRRSPHAAVLTPSHGKFIGASSAPMSAWAPKEGEKPGWNWRLSAPTAKRGRRVVFDANGFKTFAADRVRTPDGAAGCLRIHAPAEGGNHRMLADHFAAEYPVTVAPVGGRAVEEWKLKVNRDNDWWDCLVGNCVAASVAGLEWSAAIASGEVIQPRSAERPLSLKDLRAKNRGRTPSRGR